MGANHNLGSRRVLGYSWACPSVLWDMVDEHTYKCEKKVHERKDTRDRSSSARLHPTRQVVLRRWLVGVVPSAIKGRTLPLES
jgi:hypothetical protein